MKEKTNSKNGSYNPDVKTSTVNLFLNITLFMLGGLLIYLIFSIFIKVTNKEKPDFESALSSKAADIIQVEVLNGCGTAGVADRFTDFLRKNNFDVVNTGNYISYDVDESMVIDRIGNLANAKKIAASLGIKPKNVLSQVNNDYFLDVSVIIGKDYFSLTPLN